MIKLGLTTKVCHGDGEEHDHQGGDDVGHLGELAHGRAGEAGDAPDKGDPGEDLQLHEDRDEAQHGHKELHEAARCLLLLVSVPHDPCGDECLTLGAAHVWGVLCWLCFLFTCRDNKKKVGCFLFFVLFCFVTLFFPFFPLFFDFFLFSRKKWFLRS